GAAAVGAARAEWGVVQAREERGDGALARAAGPDQRDHLAGMYTEAHVVERRPGLRVARRRACRVLRVELVREAHVPELELAPERRGLLRPRRVVDGRTAGEHLGDPLDARADLPDGRPLLDELASRLEHVLDEHDEEDQGAHAERVAGDQPDPEPSVASRSP